MPGRYRHQRRGHHGLDAGRRRDRLARLKLPGRRSNKSKGLPCPPRPSPMAFRVRATLCPTIIDPIVSADPEVECAPALLRCDPQPDRHHHAQQPKSPSTKLTIRGNAGLNIAETGDLTSLIDINQFRRHTPPTVNGNLTSVGDYTLFARHASAGTGKLLQRRSLPASRASSLPRHGGDHPGNADDRRQHS